MFPPAPLLWGKIRVGEVANGNDDGSGIKAESHGEHVAASAVRVHGVASARGQPAARRAHPPQELRGQPKCGLTTDC
jgi:hypothetical protein